MSSQKADLGRLYWCSLPCPSSAWGAAKTGRSVSQSVSLASIFSSQWENGILISEHMLPNAFLFPVLIFFVEQLILTSYFNFLDWQHRQSNSGRYFRRKLKSWGEWLRPSLRYLRNTFKGSPRSLQRWIKYAATSVQNYQNVFAYNS